MTVCLMPKIIRLKDILPRHSRVIDRHSVYMPHDIYTREDLDSFKVTHRTPTTFGDKFALTLINMIRRSYDFVTGYNIDNMSENKWIIRCLFLETVAGVPGMVAGMGTHMKCIRDLENDRGTIHHLLEEAENERFHLHFFLGLKKPGILFRMYILLAQGAFMAWYIFTYTFFRRFSHRFVGYLEEQAVHTYTNMLRHIEDDLSIHHWKLIRAPEEARLYWSLADDATLRDVVEIIRMDEASHREVNHFFADIEAEQRVDYQPL